MIKEFQGHYRWLSNFWPCSVSYSGIVYNTPENAYQAAKCAIQSEREQFQCCTPGRAKQLSKKITIRDNWDDIKLEIMRDLQIQKYQNPVFRKLLMDTGVFTHIEEGNMWGDTFWGVCLKTDKGQNHLGKIIMRIRTDIYWDSL